METLYYCGFNGFKQVPSSANNVTLTSLVPHKSASNTRILDVDICWNYLVVVQDGSGITKYGLVDGKNGSVERLTAPPHVEKIVQLSATPRHLLVCTDNGECWTHEENKGWRKVHVGAEPTPLIHDEDPAAEAINAPNAESADTGCLIDIKPEPAQAESPPKKRLSMDHDVGPGSPSCHVKLVKTSCGDAHNIGLDAQGVAYSLPSPLDFDVFPANAQHRVTDVVCGKEHCLLLTEHGQVYSWGGGSRGQLGHGSLNSEEKPRLITALDGMKIKKIAAGGWHSAVISQFDDLYMFGWNESGQLAQTTNLVRPAECFAAVEKLLMACCTMQPEDTNNPRGDSEDCEVYHKNNEEVQPPLDPEKDALTCYNAATSCNDSQSDLVVVQNIPMLVQIPGKSGEECQALDVSCGSRHTVVLTSGNQLWGFGWNKYGQLGLGHTTSKDAVEKIPLPKGFAKNSVVKMLRCGDWGTAVVISTPPKKS
ncbi:hypothetical protein TCAL_00742 [Tigriopus californicus]|uniref:Uncharacterized protein n=1 Tax=Tigriopus californicus TaxID=6832 RepID=A0A553PCA3_TIGCA|nr:E3 ISG15--protein ligase HERC5-like [Tigriopus californicus]TRY75321.1 hypothetical protein TCAL_00742 [Tigriopus californicus]|eukprot:TCALIF_00742-PA protein Name:"Similar to RCCD1 RCC1 domain-containing protein 1 (Homo sapiens)" AED:0.00 eAED:0.00 QI:47/1/1/1/1/1/2/477/479